MPGGGADPRGAAALLTREPVLGNKVLLKLVSLLSDRLRETSAHLVNCLGRVA